MHILKIVIQEHCSECRGSGVTEGFKNVHVTVPPGFYYGIQLCLAMQYSLGHFSLFVYRRCRIIVISWCLLFCLTFNNSDV